MTDATLWYLAEPHPTGPVVCPACRRPAARTAQGYLCVCGAKQYPGEPIAPLIGELAEAQAEATRRRDARRARTRGLEAGHTGQPASANPYPAAPLRRHWLIGHRLGSAERERAALAAQPRVGVGVLLRAGGCLLMGLRRGPAGGGSWSVPSGHLERGETPLACAARELREETGIAGVELAMLTRGALVATYDGGHATWPDFVTLWAVGVVAPGTEALVLEPEKCAEWRWIMREEAPRPLFRCFASLLAAGVDPWACDL